MTDAASPQKPTVRFAPSPTGALHIGNLRTALFNWLFTKQNGGQFILRLDDTDAERSTQAFADGIVEDLRWIGIMPDRKERQSDRLDSYAAAAERLKTAGVLYPCYESADEIERRRKRLMARGLPPVYDRAALKLSPEDRVAAEAEGRPAHWRFLLPNHDGDPFAPSRTEVIFDDLYRGEQIVDLASMSDPVLIREDGSFLYTLPSVVDDMEMGVSHVIRGGDHIANTGVQIALFEALGAKTLPTFGHHNLLLGADGEGLSKRDGSLSLASMREGGVEPMAVATIAALVGTNRDPEPAVDLDALAAVLDGAHVSKAPSRFDPAEVAALNERLLHAMPYATAQPRLAARNADLGEAFWNATRANLETFDGIDLWVTVVGGDMDPAIDAEDGDFIAQAAEMLPAEPWGEDVWSQWTAALKAATDRKGRGLFMPLRKAVTGLDHGPEMGALLPLIGWERTNRRLRARG